MKASTDLQQVKSMAKVMLFLDIEETQFSPLIVKHPYTDTSFAMIHGEDTMVNLLEDKEALNRWRGLVAKAIDEQDTPYSIYNMLTKSYLLSFIKLVEPYLSKVDLSLIWGDAWTRIEFITSNGVLTERKMVSLFRKCDPAILMNPEELERFEDLPDEIKVYRGIGSKSKKIKGMSWTTDIEVAKWFSKRFNSNEKIGDVYEAKLSREYVLAYFEGRSEHEVVIDPKGLRDLNKLKL